MPPVALLFLPPKIPFLFFLGDISALDGHPDLTRQAGASNKTNAKSGMKKHFRDRIRIGI
jgi:hypothetical protein